MSQKNLGFTLVELLAAITIMGIIILMALPSLSNLANRNALKRFTEYANTLETSAKLYTDSNSIDMFGYDNDGCYDIPFSKLEEKKLASDIDYKDITCSDPTKKRTFVRVKKYQDTYEYQVSIACSNGKGNSVYVGLIDNKNAICTPESAKGGPTIAIMPTTLTAAAASAKVSITISDLDGLFENASIEYGWSIDKNTYTGAYSSLNLGNAKNAKSVSKQLTVPNDGKTYYLFVRPDNVKDVFNNYNIESYVNGPYKAT